MMHARSTLDCSQSNNISCKEIFLGAKDEFLAFREYLDFLSFSKILCHWHIGQGHEMTSRKFCNEFFWIIWRGGA